MRTAPKVLQAYKIFRPDIEGGVPSVIATLCSATSPDFENSVLVARSQGPKRRYESDGAPVTAVPSLGTLLSMPMAPTYPFEFLKQANSSDIVVHHSPFPLTDMVAPRLARNVSLIVYWHADITGYPFLKKLFIPAITRTLARADRIIVGDPSTITTSDLLTSFAGKCAVVPYGTDLQFWSTCTETEHALASSLRQNHPRLIVSVGRLVPYKGFASLVQAMRRVDGEAIIIGDGPLRRDLTRMAHELGVADRVFFKGKLTAGEIKAHLHAARGFVLPSVTAAEAFGLVQLEAMAAGLPVVNTRLPTGVPKVARHDLEALTVEPNDSAALAGALQTFLNDSALATRLGQGGKRRALSEYSLSAYVARIEAIYYELIAQRRELSR